MGVDAMLVAAQAPFVAVAARSADRMAAAAVVAAMAVAAAQAFVAAVTVVAVVAVTTGAAVAVGAMPAAARAAGCGPAAGLRAALSRRVAGVGRADREQAAEDGGRHEAAKNVPGDRVSLEHALVPHHQ